MIYLTHEDELEIKDFTVLYFYGSWAPFHHKVCQMIDKVELPFEFIAIDTDYFKKLVDRFQIESVPTFVTFVNKTAIDTFTGVTYTKAFLHHFKELHGKSIGKNNKKQNLAPKDKTEERAESIFGAIEETESSDQERSGD